MSDSEGANLSTVVTACLLSYALLARGISPANRFRRIDVALWADVLQLGKTDCVSQCRQPRRSRDSDSIAAFPRTPTPSLESADQSQT